MYTAKITSKGQITIPAEIRERYRLETGDSLVFEARGDYLTVHRQLSLEEVRAKYGRLSETKPAFLTHAEAIRSRVASRARRDAGRDTLYVAGRDGWQTLSEEGLTERKAWRTWDAADAG